MTFAQAYKHGESVLLESGIENAFYESLWMLESVTGKSNGYLLARNDGQLSGGEAERFSEMLAQRTQGRPLQYIIGKAGFYGRDFAVSEGVLIPRPETELLVDYALEKLAGEESPVIIDLCAGSGCIGLTLACEIPGSEVYLVEKYEAALEILRKNAEGCGNAHIIKGDILGGVTVPGLPAGCDMLLSNPPYIKSGDIPHLQSEVLREPRTALDGGEDGLEFYRALKSIAAVLRPKAAAFETGEDQSEELLRLFPGAQIRKDYSGRDRILILEGDSI